MILVDAAAHEHDAEALGEGGGRVAYRRKRRAIRATAGPWCSRRRAGRCGGKCEARRFLVDLGILITFLDSALRAFRAKLGIRVFRNCGLVTMVSTSESNR